MLSLYFLIRLLLSNAEVVKIVLVLRHRNFLTVLAFIANLRTYYLCFAAFCSDTLLEKQEKMCCRPSEQHPRNEI
jgi:hypothetical protein